VARALGRHLPGPEILTAAERQGDPAEYQSHLMHAEPDGSFSVVALVWRPGQITPIHDHVTWCVVGVLQGAEYEELFALREDGTLLEEVGTNAGAAGDVSGFAPPGDIHRVRNRGTGVAISLHVYGADISRLGSSVRRIYDLPVRTAPARRQDVSS
jgi:predicted metal-dependent enzyme (double-stranded beta helix superfamily)